MMKKTLPIILLLTFALSSIGMDLSKLHAEDLKAFQSRQRDAQVKPYRDPYFGQGFLPSPKSLPTKGKDKNKTNQECDSNQDGIIKGKEWRCLYQ
ncbi:MAG: hypothetical protein KDK66_07590 [Deltaproteobacteria bacterium]|nr:hypothetical protein [Deltaproteobacteria bacterium]